jgi:hypothetical protein
MIQGRIIIPKLAHELQGVFFDENTFFNFVLDINDNYFLFLSEQDEMDLINTKYSYLLDISLSEFISKPITPPIL